MPATRVVGRYEILEQIGRGGMAVVYLARQVDLERLVALKELNSFHATDPAAARRFLQEARVAGSFAHPNIVTVHDYVECDGTPFIAMEYVERGSLRPWVGSLTVAQIGGVLGDVLAGLVHAERRGVIHRDLKPENVMITLEGQAKIADFGIAKATSRMTAAFQTATGVTVGTPGYMAPEQAMATNLGPWTDLYAVGCVAYELFVGQSPFADSDEPIALLLRHINESVPPAAEANPAVDPDISRWIDAMLVKDPERRTQHATAAWESLEEILIALMGPRWRRDATIVDAPTGVAGAPRRSIVFDASKIGGPYTPPPEGLETAPPLDPDTAFESFVLPPPSRPPVETPLELELEPTTPEPPAPKPPWPEPKPQTATPKTSLLAPTIPPRPRPALRPEPAAPRRAGPLAAAAAGLAVAVAVAVVLVLSGGEDAAPPANNATRAAGPVLAAGPLQARLPADWSRHALAVTIPGLALDPASSGGDEAGTVLLGMGPAKTTSALLARGFLGVDAPSGRTVALAGGSAYRYDELALRGRTGFLTVFALPTSEGVATLACLSPLAPKTAFATACDRVAESLSVKGAEVESVEPSDAYAERLNTLIDKLDRASASTVDGIRTAKTAKSQGTAAATAAQTYRALAAEHATNAVNLADQADDRRLVRRLEAVAAAYRALAAAGRNTAPKRYGAAAARVAAAEKGVNAALAASRYGAAVEAHLRERTIPAMKRPRAAAAPAATATPVAPAATATAAPPATRTPPPAATTKPGTGNRTAPQPTAAAPKPTAVPERPAPIPEDNG